MAAIAKISARSMMNLVFRCVTATLLLAGTAACTKDPGIDMENPDASGTVLRLSTGSSFSRGDGHYADDEYAESSGEESIRRVDLFFFEKEQTTAEPFYTWETKNLPDVTTADLTVKVPIDLLENFRGEDQAYVYALVNLPEDVVVDEKKGMVGGRPATLAALREVWVAAPEFAGAGTKPGIPASFVMRGGSQVELSGEGALANVSGRIDLERLASKIRLWAEIPEEIYLDENGKTLYQFEGETPEDWAARRAAQTVETWKSVPVDAKTGESNTALYLYNLTTRGRIDAYLGTYEERSAAANPWGYRSIDRSETQAKFARPLTEDAILNEKDVDAKYTYSHSVPFYSYPNVWDSTTPVEEHQTYVIITLPWVRQDDNGNELFQLCYYQVPVNALTGTQDDTRDRLDPNRYYRIKIRIGMLGSKDLGSPTEVDASCEVVEWRTNDVDVSIKDRRYLVVNQKNWVMNNEYELDIPFSTSHPAVVTACYVTYFRYNDIWGTDDDAVENNIKTHQKEEFNIWLEAADGQHKDYEPGLTGGLDGEGPITARYREEPRDEIYREDLLYYKKEYFYDSEYADMDEPKRGYTGFRYYVGHEHPKTFQPEAIKYYNEKLMVPYTRRKLVKGNNGKATEQNVTVSVDEQKEAWAEYNSNPLYQDINAVYTCTVNDAQSVIHLVHPLVRWDEVRKDTVINGETFNKVRYYVPVLNDVTKKTYEEFSRCEIVIKIRHADWEKNDGLYEETVYITQYPGMYIEVSHDYGAVHASSSNHATQRTYNQYVLVNGNDIWTSGGGTNDWYEPNKDQVSTVSGSNYNPNMYVIHTTQLSEEFKDVYILGDPRTLYYNNVLTNESFKTYKSKNSVREDDETLPGTPKRWSDDDESRGEETTKSNGPAWWISRTSEWNGGLIFGYYAYSNYQPVTSLYKDKPNNSSDTYPNSSSGWNYINHQNNLCYYYPTDETSAGETGAKDRFIAPSFRIASSFGKVGSITIGNDSKMKARRRCATYQEAGRPAGRWRLPTRAEIEYIAQLSADGKIPILFGNSSDKAAQGHYWSATGPLLVDGLGNVDEGSENNSDYYSPRCVYDEWYWTQINEKLGYEVKPRTTEFIWGDVPKDNTQVETLLNKKNEK